MKTILNLIFLTVFVANAQYSDYYTSGNTNISNIDYEELANANAENEINRLEQINYLEVKEKEQSLEIGADPLKAYDYGFDNTNHYEGEKAKANGFKKFSLTYRVPNENLFKYDEGKFVNVSEDNIITEINFYTPYYNKENEKVDPEKEAKHLDVIAGQIYESEDERFFTHKKELEKVVVFGIDGFKGTLILEDDNEYRITDHYEAFDATIGNGVSYYFKVSTYGNKEITFEQLEGRRYYMKPLIEKIIATAKSFDVKY